MRWTTCLVSLVAILSILSPYVSYAVADDFTVVALIGSDSTPPTAPGGLITTPISFDQVDLNWTASSDNISVGGYQIWRDNLQIATTTLVSYVDAGLQPNTLYTYYITAFDTSGNISASSTLQSTTTGAIPVTPPAGGNSNSTRVPSDALNIYDWNVVAGEDRVEITFRTDQSVRTNTSWGTGSTYELGYSSQNALLTKHRIVVDGLDMGARYSFQVLFFDRFGRPIGERTFVVEMEEGIDTTSPPNVRNFSGVFEDGAIDLDWQNPEVEDFSYVKILRSERFFPLDNADGIVVYEGDASSVRDTDLRDAITRYYYTIFSYDTNGNRSSGAVTMVVLPGDIPPPIEPTTASSSTAVPVMFHQGEFVQESSSTKPVRLLQTEQTLIRIAYDSLPQNLKTIIVSLTYIETGQTFSFILRSNNDRTYYEAILDVMPYSGLYDVSVEVFDYKLKTFNRNSFQVSVIGEEVETTSFSVWYLVPLFFSALILFILWRRFVRN